MKQDGSGSPAAKPRWSRSGWTPALLELAKERTGIETTSALIETAVANLILEDEFTEAFLRSRGTIPADIDLEI